jgi:hypothetical protein
MHAVHLREELTRQGTDLHQQGKNGIERIFVRYKFWSRQHVLVSNRPR